MLWLGETVCGAAAAMLLSTSRTPCGVEDKTCSYTYTQEPPQCSKKARWRKQHRSATTNDEYSAVEDAEGEIFEAENSEGF